MSDTPLPGFREIPPEARDAAVVVGFSGGLDSTVLLHALAAAPARRARGLRAVHVHHGLHPDADAWAQACAATCAALDVPLHLARVVVARRGHGLEAAARDARRRAFAGLLADGEALALAHHRDDQAETFLRRALRASGPDGLAAMRAWQPFGRAWMWRPLLDVPRAALQAYAIRHGLRWIDDPANAALAHDRNFLRHRVLPLLRERWPDADAAFARAARLAAEAVDLLADEDAVALAAVRTADPRVLSVEPLRALPAARRARVLRAWIATLRLPPLPAQGVARIEDDLLAAARDGAPVFVWQDAVVRRWRDLLHADRQRPPLPADWQTEWTGRDALLLPGDGRLELIGGAPRLASVVRVRARRGGERITLPGRTHSHALKHVLQDAGIPPWERERLPLLFDADARLLAAGDLVYSDAFDAWLRAHSARLAWTPDRDDDGPASASPA